MKMVRWYSGCTTVACSRHWWFLSCSSLSDCHQWLLYIYVLNRSAEISHCILNLQRMAYTHIFISALLLFLSPPFPFLFIQSGKWDLQLSKRYYHWLVYVCRYRCSYCEHTESEIFLLLQRGSCARVSPGSKSIVLLFLLLLFCLFPSFASV